MDELFNIRDIMHTLAGPHIFIIGDHGKGRIDDDLKEIINQYCEDKRELLNERLSAL
jgi:hypothetical protein